MGRGFRALGAALHQVGTNLTLSAFSSLAGTAVSIPVLLLVGLLALAIHSLSTIPIGIVLLVGVLPNPALAGLQAVNCELTHGTFPNSKTFKEGLRQYWRPALRVWLVGLAVTIVIIVNLAFYITQNKTGSLVRPVATPLTIIWLVALVFWLTMHLYVYPLILAQETMSILVTYRNAALLVLAHPLYSGGVAIVWLVLSAFFSATGLAAFIGLAVDAAIQQNAFARLIPLMRVSGVESAGD